VIVRLGVDHWQRMLLITTWFSVRILGGPPLFLLREAINLPAWRIRRDRVSALLCVVVDRRSCAAFIASDAMKRRSTVI
jgi:hypothetical protein